MYLEDPDARLLVLWLVEPDPGCLVVGGGEDEVVDDEQLVDLPVVPPVDVEAVAGGHVPLADGAVVGAGVHELGEGGHASDVRLVAPGRVTQWLRTALVSTVKVKKLGKEHFVVLGNGSKAP